MQNSTGEPGRLAALRQGAADAFSAGRFADSLSLARQALALAPGDYDALQVAVMAAMHGGDAQAALAHAQELAAAFPDDAYACNSLGAALQVAGHLGNAIDAYGRATTLAPGYADGWLNMGLCCLQAGELARAVAPLGEAARLVPDSPDIAGFAAAAEIDSGHDFAAGVRHLQRARSREPQAARWRFLEALAWPPMLASRAQAEERMPRMLAQLDALVATPAPLQDPVHEVGKTAFYTAYAGLDDTQLQRRLAEAYLAATPSLAWRAPHVDAPPPGFRRIRVGILSAFLNNHTIGKLNIGLVQFWDRRRFEVIVIRPPGPEDEICGFFNEAADGHAWLPRDLQAAREQVAALKLDALFYPDVGMDAFTYFLAFARLAKVQFTTWGHPVTTGIPNMDAFISHRHAEPEGAERLYHEKLVRFENLPSYYHPPRTPSAVDMRAKLGIGREQRLYACPQTLFKFHPDQDAALCEILRRDPRGVLVMIASKHPAWNETLQARLRAAGPDVAGRIRFIEALPLPDFFALVRDADALLDTFWFGGGNSSYEAFGHGRPVVTLPAPMMRGRVTHAWYRQMGEDAWIAQSPGHSVELAVRLANDEAWRRESRERIAAAAGRIIGNQAVVREYEAFVERSLRP